MTRGRGKQKRVAAALVALGLCACSRKEPPAVAKTATTAHAARASGAGKDGTSAENSPVPSPSSLAGVNANVAMVSASANATPHGSSGTSTGGILPAEERTWTFESPALGSVPVVVVLPPRRADERFPVLIAMHGRGEALKGPARGARGWVDDYRIGKALARLQQPPLSSADFLSFVTKERLDRINRALGERPYRGLVLAFPYTPDVLQGESFFEGATPLGELFVRELIPRLYRETPAIGSAATTGIDGVSLGGRAAYSVGLLRPEAFGVVGALQAAFDLEEVPLLLAQARAAQRKHPKIAFRLLTSQKDYFREPDSAIARAFSRAGLPMTFDIVEGPHDYDFNRGPGAIEMLVFHDRALRGDPPP
jgi:iron(III)-salmochelin esterase